MADPIYPDAAEWINALEAGQRAGMTDRKNVAVRQAGGFMAAGDYQGAAKSLYGAGDFQDGSAIAAAGYAQTNQNDKLTRQKAVQEKLAAGDIAGAWQAAGTDPELQKGLEGVTAHAKETTGLLASALQALKGPDGQWLPEDQARVKYHSEIAPLLISQRQMDPAQVNNFEPTPGNLSAIESQVLGLKEQLGLAQKTAEMTETARHNRATEEGYTIVPEGGKAIPRHPQTEMQPAPMAAAPTMDQRAAVEGLAANSGRHGHERASVAGTQRRGGRRPELPPPERPGARPGAAARHDAGAARGSGRAAHSRREGHRRERPRARPVGRCARGGWRGARSAPWRPGRHGLR
jgi:hypothetical protein